MLKYDATVALQIVTEHSRFQLKKRN